MRAHSRRSSPFKLEPLEDRTTPAASIGLSGNVVAFHGDAANDALTLTTSSSGLLQHNWSGNGLASDTDLDSATDGVQTLAVTAITGFTVDLAAGTDTLTLHGMARAITISNSEKLQLHLTAQEPDGDITLTNAAITVNDVPTPYLYAISGVLNVDLTGGSGANTIDGSVWTGNTLKVNAGDGNDTVIGHAGIDDIDLGPGAVQYAEGGAGADFIFGGDGNDTIHGGPDNDLIYAQGGNDSVYGGTGQDQIYGETGNDFMYDGVGPNFLCGGADNDVINIAATSAKDIVQVNIGSVSINGDLNEYCGTETLIVDAGSNVDHGIQAVPVHPLAYIINNLEPTVSLPSTPALATTQYTAAGSFQDIGSGQTWTATVNYGDGTGPQTLMLSAEKTFTLNHTYTNAGAFNVTIQVTDHQGNTGSSSTVITRLPAVATINDGALQRSRISSITMAFDQPLTLNPGWFAFASTTGGQAPLATPTLSEIGGRTVAVFTFTGDALPDGRFALTINGANALTNAGHPWDGDANGTSGGNSVLNVHSLFGDSDGNGRVEASDATAFEGTFGQTAANSPFDFDGNGSIDGSDFAQFGDRFGMII